MFYFRINKLRIIDNKERPRFLGLFGLDVAQVKLISFISTDNMQLPDMSLFLRATTHIEKKRILQSFVQQVVNMRVLTTIHNVKDNHIMYFGDTGYVLFQSKTIPAQLHWQLLAYESDENFRDNARLAHDIISDSNFDGFTDDLGRLLSLSGNPNFMASVAIGRFASEVAVKAALRNKDDMIGIMYMSLNRQEHYPHGERKKDNVPDMTNNMMVDYSIFGFEDEQPPAISIET